MRPCIIILLCLAGLFAGQPTRAAVAVGITENHDWVVNAEVPDDDPVGFANTQSVSSAIVVITGLEVRLDVSGGWNGDLYAYLSHREGFSVLLNRPGRTAEDLLGSGSSGLTVTLSDLSDRDIHTELGQEGLITGIFSPDGRAVDPGTVLDTSPRTASLDSFQGLSARGDWTLFVADLSAGGQSRVTSWGLKIDGIVPEPSGAVLWGSALIALAARRQRRSVRPG